MTISLVAEIVAVGATEWVGYVSIRGSLAVLAPAVRPRVTSIQRLHTNMQATLNCGFLVLALIPD